MRNQHGILSWRLTILLALGVPTLCVLMAWGIVSCERRSDWQYIRIPTAPDTVRDTVVVVDTVFVPRHRHH